MESQSIEGTIDWREIKWFQKVTIGSRIGNDCGDRAWKSVYHCISRTKIMTTFRIAASGPKWFWLWQVMSRVSTKQANVLMGLV